MRILAIDGGGVRGAFAAHVLRRIQVEYDICFHEHFELIAGTSTGSIIAAAIANDRSIYTVAKLYEHLGPRIFRRKSRWRVGLFRSKYSSRELREELERFFADLKMSDARTRLLIPATDIGNGSVHVFKSGYNPNSVRNPDVRVSDAVLASCSAPLYFDPAKVSNYLLSDGGLWANNPSRAAITEARGKLKQPLELQHPVVC